MTKQWEKINFYKSSGCQCTKTETEKRYLTKSDIDAHALMILQSNGQWNCIDCMLPYMTESGISRVENVKYEKNKNANDTSNSKKSVKTSKKSVKTNMTSADEEALSIMQNSGTWGESILRLLPSMSSVGIEKMLYVYLNKHIFPDISTPENIRVVEKDVQSAYSYMTEKAIQRVKNRINSYK